MAVTTNTYEITSLQRGLHLLDTLYDADEPLKLEELVSRTGLPKSTVYRLVMNLLNADYITETPDGYWLSLKLLRLGSAVESKLELKRLAAPLLLELRDKTGETVHLACLDEGLNVVYLEKLSSQHAVGLMVSRVGMALPMYCTGLGKAMAAFKPAQDVHAWLENNTLTKFTSTTLSNKQELLAELERIRQRGYATDEGEHEPSIRCVAAPIRNRKGDVIAGVSVAGPENRMPRDLIGSDIALEVANTANNISAALGWHAKPDPLNP